MTTESFQRPRLGAHDRRRWIVLALIVAAQFMVVLDIAIVNVALPSIKTRPALLPGQPAVGDHRLLDPLRRRADARRPARRPARPPAAVHRSASRCSPSSSLLDGLAWSEGSLIAFRSLQGLGAALLSPAALSILTTTFAEGRERNLALGIWGAVSGSGAAAGVLLGGALTSGSRWSWIFFINVPVGVAVIALDADPAAREPRRRCNHRHFDLAGAGSITGRPDAARLRDDARRAARLGRPLSRSCCSAASAGLIAAFFVIESRSPAPLLPLRIFRLRTLSGSNVSGLLMGGAIFAQFFLLTLYMQEVLHYSALHDRPRLHQR